jgi:hypothetical protein
MIQHAPAPSAPISGTIRIPAAELSPRQYIADTVQKQIPVRNHGRAIELTNGKYNSAREQRQNSQTSADNCSINRAVSENVDVAHQATGKQAALISAITIATDLP